MTTGLDGSEKLAEGREAEIFTWEGGRVLKLHRSPGSGYRREAAALSALSGAGDLAPELVETIHVDGRPGLVLGRIEGVDMLAVMERRPWQLFGLARALARIQVQINETAAPRSLPSQRDVLASRITSNAAPAKLAEFALRKADELPDGDALCHGDFHPGNVLVTQGGFSVIDWTNASRGDADGDFVRTTLLMKLGAPPEFMSSVMKAMIAVGRGAFARSYARSYLRLRPVAPERRRRWEVVHAAARFAEGIESEFPALTSLIENARMERHRRVPDGPSPVSGDDTNPPTESTI